MELQQTKMILGIGFKNLGIIIGILGTVLTLQTFVLNELATGREAQYRAKQITEDIRNNKELKDEVLAMFNKIISNLDNVYTMSEMTYAMEGMSKEAEKGAKQYTDSENHKQEVFYDKMFKDFFSSAYLMDEKDSTFKVIYYKHKNDITIIRYIPILTSDWENGNYE